MILAELVVCHSRPIAPTRRVALGDRDLPVDPPPGFGGVLLGGIVARFTPDLDEDDTLDLDRLLKQVDRGMRIAQPRLRHRFQADVVGLTKSRHRLVGIGETIEFEFEDGKANAAQHVLAAVYAAAEMPPAYRHVVIEALRVGLTWRGEIGPSLAAVITGRVRTGSVPRAALSDPLRWARLTLGFQGEEQPTKVDVQRRFRELLRVAHPDHGGEVTRAANRISDLTEARKILLR
jgi:hypothetical protein